MATVTIEAAEAALDEAIEKHGAKSPQAKRADDALIEAQREAGRLDRQEKGEAKRIADETAAAARDAEAERAARHGSDCVAVHAAARDVQITLQELAVRIRVLVERQRAAEQSAGRHRFALRAMFDDGNGRFPSVLLAELRGLNFSGIEAMGHLEFPWRPGATPESFTFAYGFRKLGPAPDTAADDESTTFPPAA